MDTHMTRTWAEIDLGAIAHNYREIRKRIGPDCKFLGVVKANAYGHGDTEVAHLLQSLGAEYLAVATVDEAIHLRRGGICLPILILGCTPPFRTEELLQYNLTQSISDLDDARQMSAVASAGGRQLRVHIKVDSGMGRLGFICHHGEDPVAPILEILQLPGLEAEGIFTHFAVSECLDDPYTQQQFHDFISLVEKLESISGHKFEIRHCSNSGAMINYREMRLNMVRPGIALYGLYPGKDQGELSLRPAMSFRSRIVQLKTAYPEYSISYGRIYTAKAPRRIAVIPVGYADGLHRVLSNQFQVLVRGQRVSQVGRICMDMCMVDVTDVPDAAVGDCVTIFGADGEEVISADEIAASAGTISYEILCAISPRIPRVYTWDGVIRPSGAYTENGSGPDSLPTKL